MRRRVDDALREGPREGLRYDAAACQIGEARTYLSIGVGQHAGEIRVKLVFTEAQSVCKLLVVRYGQLPPRGQHRVSLPNAIDRYGDERLSHLAPIGERQS